MLVQRGYTLNHVTSVHSSANPATLVASKIHVTHPGQDPGSFEESAVPLMSTEQVLLRRDRYGFFTTPEESAEHGFDHAEPIESKRHLCFPDVSERQAIVSKPSCTSPACAGERADAHLRRHQ